MASKGKSKSGHLVRTLVTVKKHKRHVKVRVGQNLPKSPAKKSPAKKSPAKKQKKQKSAPPPRAKSTRVKKTRDILTY